MIEELDFKQLTTMAAFLKAESESASELTIEFIECLIKRYNLTTAITEIEFEGVPDEIINKIKEGVVPTKEDLLPLDSGEQNLLIMELIWFAGMNRVGNYCEDEQLSEGEPGTLDTFIAMQSVSTAHWIASYLVASLTLLFCTVPSYPLIETLTNNFEDTEENIGHITNLLLETCGAIYNRYHEDNLYYDFKSLESDA